MLLSTMSEILFLMCIPFLISFICLLPKAAGLLSSEEKELLMYHKSSKEYRNQRNEIHARKFRDGKDVDPKAKECFERPPYYMQVQSK